jgi:uncharacterized protein YkwD
MKKLIILVSVFISSNVVSQIQYDGTNLKDVVLQQAASTRKADSIRITKNILTNTKLIDSLNQLIVDEINRIRKQHNLPIVQRIKSKDAACQIYAKQMLDDNAIGHYSDHPDAVWEICVGGINMQTKTFKNDLKLVVQQQIQAWMNSPGHRLVILGTNFDSNFEKIAIGQQWQLVNEITPSPVIIGRTVVRFF